MRVVFMGTPDFAVPTLQGLAAHHELALVVTRPDAVRGRGKTLVPSPVKCAAKDLGIEVAEAKRISPELVDRIQAIKPDLLVVAAYGAILPDDLLNSARLGAINVHASLLPRWRGAAPIQQAILAGDERAGVSIMAMAHELDAGPWCRQASTEIGSKSCAELTAELARLGARELLAAVEDLAAGSIVWHEQDAALVTYASKISKAEMRLDPAESAHSNALRVQASTDAAPARLAIAGQGLRVLTAQTSKGQVLGGHVLIQDGRVLLGCSDGALEILSVKPDGKRAMEASAWAAGRHASDLVWNRI